MGGREVGSQAVVNALAAVHNISVNLHTGLGFKEAFFIHRVENGGNKLQSVLS
jgi:hypothetical protein